MGEVFEAVRTGPGGFRRAVALKRLIGDGDGASVQRFLAEARILASLHHPNVIEVHDVIAAESGYVLVMELLTGATLHAIVRAVGETGLPADELCAIADQALAGLEYIHAARGEDGRPLGLIHRDLTPNNLFITDGGELKLIDFGIAKLRSALDAPLTRDGEIHGTLELIAPEQARGEATDPRTDLYQLAATLYWTLTGRYPHGSGTTIELITRAATLRPPLLAELRPDLPAGLVTAIDRTMALEPAERLDDAAAMRAAMRAAVPTDGEVRLAARVRSVPVRPVNEPLPGTVKSVEALIDTAPSTVADKPSARRHADAEARAAVAPVRRRRWPIALAVAGAAGAGVASVVALRPASDRATVPHEHDRSTLVEIPGSVGVVSAAPLAGDLVVVATATDVRILPEHGGEARPLAIPRAMVPVDVEGLAGEHVAVTVQGRDGNFQTFVDGARDAILYRSVAAVVAVSPDGSAVARADRGYSGTIDNGKLPTTSFPIHLDVDLILGLGWAPDGKRVAAIHDRGRADPTIEVVDVATAKLTPYAHPPFDGDVAVFGWLDTDHLAYVLNRTDGATLYRFTIATQAEQIIKQLPGERVTGGHVARGVVTVLHGIVHHELLVGSPHELHATAITDATSIAGFDATGQVVIGRAAATPARRAADGTTSPWPAAGAAGDRLETMIEGAVFAVRAGNLYRLGSGARRLVTASAPRDTAMIRCAGDAALPCVIVDSSERALRYRTFDPDTATSDDHWLTEGRGLDHALSRDGKLLAIVDGKEEIRIYNLATREMTWRKVGGGATLEAVAWSGDEVIVSARSWRQHPWALLAVDGASQVRMVAAARDRVAAQIRATSTTIAVVTTDVTPVLSLIHVD